MRYPGDLKPFAMNPGDLLAAVLRARKIEKTDFANRLGTTYQTVNRWTNNKGFTAKKRVKCAEKLGLDPNYFELSNHDDRSREREAFRRQVFVEFLQTDLGKRLSESDPEVIAALNTTPFPAGRQPSVDAYTGLALVFTRQLDPEDVDDAIQLNEAVTARIAKSKKSPGGRSPKGAQKGPRSRGP